MNKGEIGCNKMGTTYKTAASSVLKIAVHQHNADRLKYPLKRVDNRFERISWDHAINEISRFPTNSRQSSIPMVTLTVYANLMKSVNQKAVQVGKHRFWSNWSQLGRKKRAYS